MKHASIGAFLVAMFLGGGVLAGEPPNGSSPNRDATPPAAPPPAPPTEKEGYLRIASTPWARIQIDGKDTPFTTPQRRMKLAPGTHQVTLSNPRLGLTDTFSVEIKEGKTTVVIKQLAPLPQ